MKTKDETQVVTFRIPKVTWNALEIFCIERGLSMSDIYRLGVASLLMNNETPDYLSNNLIGTVETIFYNPIAIGQDIKGVFMGFHSRDNDGCIYHYEMYKVSKEDFKTLIRYDEDFESLTGSIVLKLIDNE